MVSLKYISVSDSTCDIIIQTPYSERYPAFTYNFTSKLDPNTKLKGFDDRARNITTNIKVKGHKEASRLNYYYEYAHLI